MGPSHPINSSFIFHSDRGMTRPAQFQPIQEGLSQIFSIILPISHRFAQKTQTKTPSKEFEKLKAPPRRYGPP
jgi:hypothetical protein